MELIPWAIFWKKSCKPKQIKDNQVPSIPIECQAFPDKKGEFPNYDQNGQQVYHIYKLRFLKT